MYGFVTHTWNPIKGKCRHDCSYCYMKRWGNQKPIRLDQKDLQTDLGKGNFIFVGSSTDMFAEDVPEKWIRDVLAQCRKYSKNKYLFQSKNPQRFVGLSILFLENVIYTTTLESNREYPEIYKEAPSIWYRHAYMRSLSRKMNKKVMITIEPILDFDFKEFVEMIRDIEPDQVNIGADSCGHKMPEPPKEKIQSLIDELSTFTKVHLKPNLKRLMR